MRPAWLDWWPAVHQECLNEGDPPPLPWCDRCDRPVQPHDSCVACGVDTGPHSDLSA